MPRGERLQCTRESGTNHILCSCTPEVAESCCMTQEHTGCLLGLENEHRYPESPLQKVAFRTQVLKRKGVDIEVNI